MEKNIIVCENGKRAIKLEALVKYADENLQHEIVKFLCEHDDSKNDEKFLNEFTRSASSKIKAEVAKQSNYNVVLYLLSDEDVNVRFEAINTITNTILKDVEHDDEDNLLEDFTDDLDELLDTIDSNIKNNINMYYYKKYKLELISRMLIVSKLYAHNGDTVDSTLISKNELFKYVNRSKPYLDKNCLSFILLLAAGAIAPLHELENLKEALDAKDITTEDNCEKETTKRKYIGVKRETDDEDDE